MLIPTTDLSGKVAIVTGATKGLGNGIAHGLAQAGANVVVVSRHQKECETVAQELGAGGCKMLAQAADLGDPASISTLIKRTMTEFGKIDILINNAGTSVTKPSAELTETEWDSVLDINLKGAFLTCQQAGKIMIAQKRGKIINVASIFGLVVDPCLLPYCTSKGGLIQLTKALAVEWAPYNIQVNSIAPGYVITEMNSNFLGQEKIYERTVKKIPMRRLGKVEDIAGAAVFLASEAANYITGAVLNVDGGWLAQ